MTDDRALLTVIEVARLLQVSQRSIWSWSSVGKFPKPIKLGRLRRWRRSDVENWLAAQDPDDFPAAKNPVTSDLK